MRNIFSSLSIVLLLTIKALGQYEWPQSVSFMATARNGDQFEIVMAPDNMRPGYISGMNCYPLPSVYRDQIEEVWDDQLGYWDNSQGYWTEYSWVPGFKLRSPIDGRDWDSLEAYFDAYANLTDPDGQPIETPDPIVIDEMIYRPGTWVSVPAWVSQPGFRQVTVTHEFLRFEIMYAEMHASQASNFIYLETVSELYEEDGAGSASLIDHVPGSSLIFVDWYTGHFSDSSLSFTATEDPSVPNPFSNWELETHTFSLDIAITQPSSDDPSPPYVVGNKMHQELTFTYNVYDKTFVSFSTDSLIGKTRFPASTVIGAATALILAPETTPSLAPLLALQPSLLPQYVHWEDIQGAGPHIESYSLTSDGGATAKFSGGIYSVVNPANWIGDSTIDWNYDLKFWVGYRRIDGEVEYHHDKYPTYTLKFDQFTIEQTPQETLLQLDTSAYGQHVQVMPFSFSW